jgi:hypothetical protein
VQLFNFQWSAQPAARLLFLLFTCSSRRRLFINQSFFEQSPRWLAHGPKRWATVVMVALQRAIEDQVL